MTHKDDGFIDWDGKVWTKCGIYIYFTKVFAKWGSVTCEDCLKYKED